MDMLHTTEVMAIFVILWPILAKIWLPWQRPLEPCNQKCLLRIGRPRKPPVISNHILAISHRNAFITRRRSSSFAEYCQHFVARLNDVHAFGYKSAESERIWMKFGQLRVYGLELSLTNFGRDPRKSGSGSASRNFDSLSIK